MMAVPSLILASESRSRRTLLENAGVRFQAMGSNVDEEAIKRDMLEEGRPPPEITTALARAKALAVDPQDGSYVIGADQVLDLDGALFDKPKGREGVRAHLSAMSGKTHRLPTAVSIARNGAIAWQVQETPWLKMRPLTPAFIDCYVAACGDAVQSSVGAYHLEGMGAQLFEEIEGSFFTILGLPLLPLLAFLRSEGVIDG